MHIFFTMLKHFRRTRLIETDANVHKRVHYWGPIRQYMQVDVGGCSSMCEGAFISMFASVYVYVYLVVINLALLNILKTLLNYKVVQFVDRFILIY